MMPWKRAQLDSSTARLVSEPLRSGRHAVFHFPRRMTPLTAVVVVTAIVVFGVRFRQLGIAAMVPRRRISSLWTSRLPAGG